MAVRIPSSEKRTIEQLREHYVLEKKLAEKLKNSTREERKFLYSDLYNELYQTIPHHALLTRKKDPIREANEVAKQRSLFLPHIQPSTVYLEIGPGSCALAFRIAGEVKKVYALDVSKEITKNKEIPENFELLISDGSTIPLPENCIDIVFSNQVLEHFHPEDAVIQIQHVARVLKKGGVFVFTTPNNFLGPADISMYFDDEPTGFHLKEYYNSELKKILKEAGFKKIWGLIGAKKFFIKVPLDFPILIEKGLAILPRKFAKWLCRVFYFQIFLGIRIKAER